MTNNNMMCDLETGICGVGGDEEMEFIDLNQPKKTIVLYYVTDPICSHCWALEPVFRRFKQEYGHYFNIHHVMGGLLEKWDDTPVDPTNGISSPRDVAGHWREVGEYSRMPIDGTVWLNNPLHSSFPPSRVYKVIQKHHGDEKANEYLRRAREKLFAFNQNIAEHKIMVEIVNSIGLSGEQVVKEAESKIGYQLLKEDFELSRQLGARGFPTIVMINEDQKGVKIVGSRPLEFYINGLMQVMEGKEVKAKEVPSISSLLKEEKLLFSKEIEVLYNLDKKDVESFMKEELTSDTYEQKELLGETYFVQK